MRKVTALCGIPVLALLDARLWLEPLLETQLRIPRQQESSIPSWLTLSTPACRGRRSSRTYRSRTVCCSWASWRCCIPGGDAKSIHGRKPRPYGAEIRDPACQANQPRGGDSVSRAYAGFFEEQVLVRYLCSECGTFVPIFRQGIRSRLSDVSRSTMIAEFSLCQARRRVVPG